jgi:predicted DNA-binding transcriptional regulator AlpA
MIGLKAEPMRAQRLRVLRVREVARLIHRRQSEVWELTFDAHSGFPTAYYIPPGTFVWDEDAVHAWWLASRVTTRSRLFANLANFFA